MNYTETEITEAYENGKLFVKCLNTVEDDEGIYAIAGKEYEVVDETDDCWLIECETSSDDYETCLELQILKNDKDFELIIKK